MVASTDYTAAADDEVSLKSGDIVEVLDTKSALGSKWVQILLLAWALHNCALIDLFHKHINNRMDIRGFWNRESLLLTTYNSVEFNYTVLLTHFMQQNENRTRKYTNTHTPIGSTVKREFCLQMLCFFFTFLLCFFSLHIK